VRDVASTHRLASESLALSRTHGRVLAQDVVAPVPLPPFDNSAMDGYAIRHADALPGAVLRVTGDQFAGLDQGWAVAAGECVRITTGAPVPTGADTVVIRENTRLDDDRITILEAPDAGANIRRAGEDVAIGDPVLQAGQVLTPPRVSLAAALGLASLQVARRPTVAVFTSGDELIEPGIPLAPGQIHDSNRDLLMGLLRADGLEPTAWPRLPDDPRRVEIALRDAACAFDLVITCGAVSAGDRDHIPAVVEAFGTVHFWKVRIKPGMPLLLGSIDQARVLALPGNPVSVLATYLTVGRALIDGLQGRSEPRPLWRARLMSPVDKRHPRREFLRGRLHSGDDGVLAVEPSPITGSHRLGAAAAADVLVVVPEGVQQLPVGSVVAVMPLPA